VRDWTQQSDALRRAYEGRRVCVTGGAGFIGGHLVEAVLSLGGDVTIIDDLSAGDAELIASIVDAHPGRARFVYASILDPVALEEAVEGCSVVFHEAAIGSVPRSVREPKRVMAVNATGTVRVAEAARFAGVERIVFAASSSVYGDNPELPKRETQPVLPVSPYAASKASAEHILRAWAMTYDISTVCLRYFNIFGQRQPANGAYAAVIPAFISKLALGERPTIYGDGKTSRDFTHIDNAVYANLLAGASSKQFKGHVINVGCGGRVTLLDLLAMMQTIMRKQDIKPIFEATREGDVPHSHADISLAKDLLGYAPVSDLETGLAETISWFTGAGSGISWSDG
jgi:nucleoside-diphosphate-sugar epimerase